MLWERLGFGAIEARTDQHPRLESNGDNASWPQTKGWGALGENSGISGILKKWLPPRDSNPDMLIQSPTDRIEVKQDKGLTPAESSKIRQNPQPGRNKELVQETGEE
jgi:hypothetical protein